MPVVNYIIPPGPRARSVALTAYASGLIMPLWTYPPAAFTLVSGVISPVSGVANNPYGFGSAASDPYGGALLAEYSGIGSSVPNIPLGLTAVPLVSGLPSVPIVTSEALAAGAVVNYAYTRDFCRCDRRCANLALHSISQHPEAIPCVS